MLRIDISDLKKQEKDLTIKNANQALIIKQHRENVEKIQQYEKLHEDAESELTKINVTKYNAEQKIREVKASTRVINSTLEHAIVCPKCKHNFLTTNDDINALKNTIKQNDEIIKTKESEILKIEQLAEQKEKLIEKYSVFIEQIENLTTKIRNAENDISSNNRLLTEIKKNLTKLNDRLNVKLQSKDNKALLALSNKLKSIEEETNLLEELLPEARKYVDDLTYWKYHFSKKGMGTFLVNKVLGIIEGAINSKLRKFNVSNVVKLNGFTKLKNGDLREKIDTLVSEDGIVFENYKKFSAGERGRLNVSSVIALNSMINDNASPKGLDFIGIDESFDKGLDRSGRKLCLETLENSRVTTWFISHLNNDVGVKNKIVVEKNKKVSRIKEII